MGLSSEPKTGQPEDSLALAVCFWQHKELIQRMTTGTMHAFLLLLPGNSPCCVFIEHLTELACHASSPGACKEDPLLSIIAIIAIIIIIILSLKFQQFFQSLVQAIFSPPDADHSKSEVQHLLLIRMWFNSWNTTEAGVWWSAGLGLSDGVRESPSKQLSVQCDLYAADQISLGVQAGAGLH